MCFTGHSTAKVIRKRTKCGRVLCADSFGKSVIHSFLDQEHNCWTLPFRQHAERNRAMESRSPTKLSGSKSSSVVDKNKTTLRNNKNLQDEKTNLLWNNPNRLGNPEKSGPWELHKREKKRRIFLRTQSSFNTLTEENLSEREREREGDHLRVSRQAWNGHSFRNPRRNPSFGASSEPIDQRRDSKPFHNKHPQQIKQQYKHCRPRDSNPRSTSNTLTHQFPTLANQAIHSLTSSLSVA